MEAPARARWRGRRGSCGRRCRSGRGRGRGVELRASLRVEVVSVVDQKLAEKVDGVVLERKLGSDNGEKGKESLRNFAKPGDNATLTGWCVTIAARPSTRLLPVTDWT
jgi:hypothetical protein